MLFGSLFPKEEALSAYTVDYERLYAAGYRGLLFDIDNTLVMHGAPATPEAVSLFAHLHRMGFRTCLISNNRKPRVAPFAEAVGSAYLEKAGKPSKKGMRRAMEVLETSPKETVLIGDQLFTDIWAAGRIGMYSILVQPIHPKEEIQIVLKRYLERPLLFFYRCFRKKS